MVTIRLLLVWALLGSCLFCMMGSPSGSRQEGKAGRVKEGRKEGITSTQPKGLMRWKTEHRRSKTPRETKHKP
eukprot:jgi/Botrbrau1/10612/Bobra.154_1s0003.1